MSTDLKKLLSLQKTNQFYRRYNTIYNIPIKYPKVWKAYENHKNAFWTAQEIDYAADKDDWEKLW